uniref:COBRA-like protein n=1 Tax=Leersia perrieri TaxID=77586 RepID=A0A0D9W7P5_9ORYZ
MDLNQLILFVFLCCLSSQFADAYDPVDPNGDIIIKWDFQSIENVYTVMVSIHNHQLYRHIEQPGWRLSWRWAGNEVIWGMTGAEATEQGDCHKIRGATRPHCCEKQPVIVDLPPGTPYNNQVANCCRGGVLSSLTQSNRTSTAAFQMVVGGFRHVTYHGGARGPALPSGFGVGVPGYSCSNATNVNATRSQVDKHRHVQALRKPSFPPFRFIASRAFSERLLTRPRECCSDMAGHLLVLAVQGGRVADVLRLPLVVLQRHDRAVPALQLSLSTVSHGAAMHQARPPAPLISCAVPLGYSFVCIFGWFSSEREKPVLPGGDGEADAPVFRCTDHMCPVRVHWHVKISYREYWRVKVTISNYNLVKNYSDWNLVVQHPNLRSLTQLFSFNYQPLIQYGNVNDTGIFWGIQYYNEMLLQDGNVQTEMILKKDKGHFTFSGGWAFPRRVYFDGHECVMPPPDQYPLLPNAGRDSRVSAAQRLLIASSFLLSMSIFLV